jgi:hypothetical protein
MGTGRGLARAFVKVWPEHAEMRTVAHVQPVPVVAVPFTVTANEPTVVQVRSSNGKLFELTLRLAIHSMFELQQPNPINPGQPLLNFQASVITSSKEIT